MPESTLELWRRQDRPAGDRLRLFSAVTGAVDVDSALYPGSYVDVAASFVVPAVTYVDVDRRANRFFADSDGVQDIIRSTTGATARSVTFLHADYAGELGLPADHFDMLVSLFAGFVSAHCTRHLRVGGMLLVNSSHGDAAMASIDDRYELSGVVNSRDDGYRVSTSDLDGYLVPKRPTTVTAEMLRAGGKGIAYTRSPFAYLFRRIR